MLSDSLRQEMPVRDFPHLMNGRPASPKNSSPFLLPGFDRAFLYNPGAAGKSSGEEGGDVFCTPCPAALQTERSCFL